MEKQEEHLHLGLVNVLMAESKICFIDGEAGKLVYRGYNINDLARNSTYEEVAYLLLFGRLPTGTELKEFNSQLISQRALPDEFLRTVERFPISAPVMDNLRSAVSLLGSYHPVFHKGRSDKSIECGISLIAKFSTIVALLHRLRHNLKPIHPEASLSFAANFLYMLHGKKPDDVAIRAMDMDFVLHAEHGFNASTMAARVTISTLSDIYSAITSAVGTLKGPLHGGAAGEAFQALKEIGSAANAESYAKKALAQDGKISGFGHRVYKITDPRALHLREVSKQLAEKTGNTRFFSIAQRLEEVVIPLLKEKRVYPNVDFYSGIVYDNLGIPEELFDAIFAVGRSAGWVAHTLEQVSENKLIRPREKYTGPMDLTYIPIEQRKF